MEMIYWDNYYNIFIITNLVILIALFTGLRIFSGIMARVNADHELFKKDNPAFGIMVVGVIFAITLILSGNIYGRPDQNVFESATTLVLHGTLGIVFMIITRIIFDKVTLTGFSVRNQIVKGNIAVAIADAGNVITAAIIIRAVLVWVHSNSIGEIGALIAGYVMSQIILTFSTLIKIRLFRMRNEGKGIQSELMAGNTALALRFAGHKIGTAFAISIATNMIVAEVYEIVPVLSAWFLMSLLVIILLKVISVIAEKIILFGVDVHSEVVEQRNIAVGALQAVIYISMGMVLSGL